MIPDFKTYIGESVWGDIRKQGLGKDVKAEDDVNTLDREGLLDYLNTIYKNLNSFAKIKEHPTFNTISVPVLIKGSSYRVYYDFNTNEVFVEYGMPYLIPGFFTKLSDQYKLKSYIIQPGSGRYIISPKDGGEVNNKFFIDVIDFIINNIPDSFERGVERIIKESVWGDIRKQGLGIETKEEDSFDFLDRDEFYDYLKNNYKETSTYEILNWKPALSIYIPICKPMESPRKYFDLTYQYHISKPEKYLSIAPKVVKESGLYKKLKEKYCLKAVSDGKSVLRYLIKPYDSDNDDVSNTFVIDVLNYIIDTPFGGIIKLIEHK